MSRKKISVCITHYNRPHTLARTLESLARQTRVPDEVFLWDDCSPRDPSEVVREWADRFPHFVYHRNAQNLNMPGNLNEVIAQATGDYVANLHDADIYDPCLLEKWSAALDRYPEAGLVFCRDSRWDNPRFVETWTPDPPEFLKGVNFFDRYFLGHVDSIIWGTVMVRRSLYERLLPFDSQFRNWADVDMWMRICSISGIAYVPKLLITLDENPTHGGGFSFQRMKRVQSMVYVNAQRIFKGEKRVQALKIQRRTWRRLWLRWMLGRLRRGEWLELCKGLQTNMLHGDFGESSVGDLGK